MILDDILCSKTFSVNQSILIYDEGFMIGSGKFLCTVTVCPGDTLKVSHSLLSKELIKEALTKQELYLNEQLVYKETKATRVEKWQEIATRWNI